MGYQAGEVFANKYRVVAELGRGGTSAVLHVKSLNDNRDYAVKILHPHLFGKSDTVKRFQKEAKVAASLLHPGIVRVVSMDVSPEKEPFIVMEYLDGQTLEQFVMKKVARGQSYSEDEFVEMALQLCRAMEYLHAEGLVHRNLKPSNILVTRDDQEKLIYKITDLGLVKVMPGFGFSIQNITRSGLAMGSPHYMSPEQWQGKANEPPSDIYALGCVFYRVLAGRTPFTGKNALNLGSQHMEDVPERFSEDREDLPHAAALESVIFKCMEKLPGDRFASMKDLREAIEAASQGQVFDTPLLRQKPKSKEEIPQAKKTPSLRRQAIVGALVLLSLVSATIFFATRPKPALRVKVHNQTAERRDRAFQGRIPRSLSNRLIWLNDQIIAVGTKNLTDDQAGKVLDSVNEALSTSIDSEDKLAAGRLLAALADRQIRHRNFAEGAVLIEKAEKLPSFDSPPTLRLKAHLLRLRLELPNSPADEQKIRDKMQKIAEGFSYRSRSDAVELYRALALKDMRSQRYDSAEKNLQKAMTLIKGELDRDDYYLTACIYSDTAILYYFQNKTKMGDELYATAKQVETEAGLKVNFEPVLFERAMAFQRLGNEKDSQLSLRLCKKEHNRIFANK